MAKKQADRRTDEKPARPNPAGPDVIKDADRGIAEGGESRKGLGRPEGAPIDKPVRFATLTITARFCYSTPQSETPETTAFVQIEDHRPDQPARRVFSGWMYGSSPGLNGVEHPLYDVWVISCNNAPAQAVASNNSAATTKVAAPDSSDKEGIQALPEGAGQ